MNLDTYFPRGIALGQAFCNRVAERNRLISNIKAKQHTLIMSPRRYGKTSLVKYAAHEVKTIFGEADLFVALDAKHIEHQIITAIKNMISQINTPIEQVLESLRHFFINISAKWTIGTQGLSFVLTPAVQQDSATVIKEALQALDYLLTQKKTDAVFFIDEMQEIGVVAEGKGIEGAIRHVAQHTQHLSFVFSGSNRHLLSNMFYDKARPLYKLCDKMILERIAEDSYKKHINWYIQQKWHTNLAEDAFVSLMSLTERHPFYVNILCRRVFESAPHLPTADAIQIAWEMIVNEERQELAKEISNLSSSQRKLLVAIASGQEKEFTGKVFLQKINMTGSTISAALKSLKENDYIEKQKNGAMHLIDPLLSSALNIYYRAL